MEKTKNVDEELWQTIVRRLEEGERRWHWREGRLVWYALNSISDTGKPGWNQERVSLLLFAFRGLNNGNCWYTASHRWRGENCVWGGVMFTMDVVGGIWKSDPSVRAIVAIGCQRGEHVSYDRVYAAVNLRNWGDLSAQRIASTVDQIVWPRYLGRLVTGSSVCVGGSCKLTALPTYRGHLSRSYLSILG